MSKNIYLFLVIIDLRKFRYFISMTFNYLYLQQFKYQIFTSFEQDLWQNSVSTDILNASTFIHLTVERSLT